MSVLAPKASNRDYGEISIQNFILVLGTKMPIYLNQQKMKKRLLWRDVSNCTAPFLFSY